jgi:hypothetical protein
LPLRNSKTIWPVPSALWRRTAATAVIVEPWAAAIARRIGLERDASALGR